MSQTEVNPLHTEIDNILGDACQAYILRELKEKMPEQQAWDIVRYVKAMMSEFDPTKKTKKTLTQQLMLLSKHFEHKKPFKEMTRDDILTYLNSCRRAEEKDPLHQWKGTYNVRLAAFKKFYRWLYYPNLGRKERIKTKPVPAQIDNLYKLERKEESIYMPSDLWTPEEDMIFFKYCPYKVIKVYHAISRDTSARPHELLNRNADEVILKSQGGVQYGEIVGSGKTTQRPLPLYNSVPFLKEWAAEHPLKPRYGIDKVPLFVVKHHNKIKRLTPETLHTYYVYKLNKGWNGGNRHYKGYFRQLLEDPLVPTEDKQIIERLLNKPWNPYIRRHTALTDKAMQLPGAAFNQHGGWSVTSKMPRRYIHFFGGESSRAVLEAEGILKKKGEKGDVLKPRVCTNCQTVNTPDAIWCINEKCRLALTLEGLQKMKEAQEKDIESLVQNSPQMVEMQKQLSSMKAFQDGFIEMLEKNPRLRQEFGIESEKAGKLKPYRS